MNVQQITPTQPGAPVIVNNVLYGQDAEVATWMNERLGLEITKVPFVAFGLIDPNSTSKRFSDALIAGVYFYNHYDLPHMRDIHIAAVLDAPSLQYRQAIKQVLGYPFGQLGLPRVTAEIDEGNAQSLRAAEVLGFQVEGRKRFMGKNGGDFLVLGLYPDSCPFWKDGN